MREFDKDDFKEYNAKPWMRKVLNMNPDYNCWGPEEDYMGDGSKYNESTKKMEPKSSGWSSNIYIDSWDDFDISLDDLNEVVHFYFEVNRDSENCEPCEQSGENPETKQLSDDWYDFANTGRKWCNNITQDEVDALWEQGRLKFEFDEKPTAEQVNEWNSNKGLGHDAINRWICVETRAKRLGVHGVCKHCEGKGYNFTAPEAHVELVLWLLHPRKGASRGVRIRNIKEDQINEVVAFLKEAKDRSKDRFSKLKRIS